MRAELELCDRWGIPHSQFLGVRCDGSWSRLDRAKALAYRELQAATCSTCGTREEEWDPERGGDRFAYVASTSRCPGCELIELERHNVPEGQHGVKVGLLPRHLYELRQRLKKKTRQRRRQR